MNRFSKFFSIGLAVGFVWLLAGCSLDASMLKLSKSLGSEQVFALKPNSSIIFTEIASSPANWTYDNAYYANPTGPSAFSSSNIVSLGMVTSLAMPTILSDVKPIIRPPGVAIANNPSEEAPYPSSFSSDYIVLSKDSESVGTIMSADGCQLAPAIPGVTCAKESISIPRDQLISGLLSIDLTGGSISLPMKKFTMSKVNFSNGVTWGRLANPEHNSGGVEVSDSIFLALSGSGFGRGCLLTNTTCKDIMFSSTGNNGFFAGPVVAGKRYFKAYKPGISRTTLYIADTDFSNIKQITDSYVSGNDISSSTEFDITEFKSKIYFTLFAGGVSSSKIFRMNPDGTDVEQITDFVSGASDSIGNLTVFGGKLLFTARTGATSADQGKLFILDTDSDGSNLTIQRIPSLAAAPEVGGIHVIDGTLYLSAETAAQGIGLYKVSADLLIWTKVANLENNYSIEFFKEGGIWFSGMKEDLADSMDSYFIFNPVASEFTLLIDLNDDGTTYNIGPEAFVVTSERIYFAGSGETESGLFSTNREGSDLKIHTAGIGVDSKLTMIADRLFFLGADISETANLYSLDAATGEDIVQHSDVASSGSVLDSMYRIDSNTLFFIGGNGFHYFKYEP